VANHLKEIVATFSDKNFEGGTHQLDDHAYRNCTFRNCRIFYGGGKVNMQDVEFTNCTVELIGAASHTLTLLRNFQNGTCGLGGQTLFNQTFQLQQ
jgi:hypothetical protein